MIACLVNKCYYVQVWLLKKVSYISSPAHFQRQRSLGIVTHLPNPPSVLPDSYTLIMADRIRGYDVKTYRKIFPLPVAPF